MKNDIKEELKRKIHTKEDHKLVKDSLFDGVKNKIVVIQKANNRL
jgi:hypothetical protein